MFNSIGTYNLIAHLRFLTPTFWNSHELLRNFDNSVLLWSMNSWSRYRDSIASHLTQLYICTNYLKVLISFYEINNMRYFDSFDLFFSLFTRFYEFSKFSICKKNISKPIRKWLLFPRNISQLMAISEGNKQPLTDKYVF